MLRRSAGIVLLTGVALVLGGCASAPTPAATGDPAPSAAASTDTVDATSEQTLTLSAVGWIAGNEVTLSSATYDPVAALVTVSLEAKNTANTDSFDAHVTGSITLDVGTGAPLPLRTASSVAVASSTTDIDLTFSAPADGLDLSTSTLQLGGPGEKQWLLPLDPDGQPTGEEPSHQALTGALDAGGFAFTVKSVDLLPWACTDSDDYGPGGSGRITYGVGAEGESAIVLWGDITESQSIVGGDTLASASLLAPDGKTSAPVGSVNTVFDLNESIEDYGLCFTVEDPTAGDYLLTWTSYRGATATLPFSLS